MSFGAVYYLIRDQVICTLTKLSIKFNLIKGQAKKSAFGQCWARRFVWHIQSIFQNNTN